MEFGVPKIVYGNDPMKKATVDYSNDAIVTDRFLPLSQTITQEPDKAVPVEQTLAVEADDAHPVDDHGHANTPQIYSFGSFDHFASTLEELAHSTIAMLSGAESRNDNDSFSTIATDQGSLASEADSNEGMDDESSSSAKESFEEKYLEILDESFGSFESYVLNVVFELIDPQGGEAESSVGDDNEDDEQSRDNSDRSPKDGGDEGDGDVQTLLVADESQALGEMPASTDAHNNHHRSENPTVGYGSNMIPPSGVNICNLDNGDETEKEPAIAVPSIIQPLHESQAQGTFPADLSDADNNLQLSENPTIGFGSEMIQQGDVNICNPYNGGESEIEPSIAVPSVAQSNFVALQQTRGIISELSDPGLSIPHNEEQEKVYPQTNLATAASTNVGQTDDTSSHSHEVEAQYGAEINHTVPVLDDVTNHIQAIPFDSTSSSRSFEELDLIESKESSQSEGRYGTVITIEEEPEKIEVVQIKFKN